MYNKTNQRKRDEALDTQESSLIYENGPGRKKSKKKIIIVSAICLISLVLIICAGLFFIRFMSISHISETEAVESRPAVDPNDIQIQPGAQDMDWMLTLVNGDHPMPADYEPTLIEIGNGEYFEEKAVDSLLKMLSDARAQGLSPLVCSAYRDEEFQTELYNNQVETQMETGLTYSEALEEAKKVVAYPGTSEHQLGLSVDIVSSEYQLLDEAQAETDVAEWLKANCYKYGFILRYPPEKTEITGVIFEPWHYRYVGAEAAAAIMNENLCLEEYLKLYSD